MRNEEILLNLFDGRKWGKTTLFIGLGRPCFIGKGLPKIAVGGNGHIAVAPTANSGATAKRKGLGHL